MPKIVKGGPLGVFDYPFFCNIENRKKIGGGPFGDSICEKKVSRNNLQKSFGLVKGGTRTLFLLLGRLQKSLSSPQKKRNKPGTAQVGASLEAHKAQGFICQKVFVLLKIFKN